MTKPASPLPSLDALLRAPEAVALQDRFGRTATAAALRAELAQRRAGRVFPVPAGAIIDAAADALARRFATSQRPVFNLSGTVLTPTSGGRLCHRPPPLPPPRRWRQPPHWNSIWRPGGVASVTSTSLGYCVKSPAPRPRQWSTTMLRRSADPQHAGAGSRGAGLAWRAD